MLSLSHIKCPAGKQCGAFHCVFGHDSDESPTPAPSPQVDASFSNVPGDGSSAAGKKSSRKRLKSASGEAVPSAESPGKDLEDSASSTPETPIKGSDSEVSAQTAGKLKTGRRPVSPPPLRRLAPKRPLPSSGDAKEPSKTPKADSDRHSTATSSRKPELIAKPKKAETLNPRLLQGSPASHEVRLKLLKMLYQEFMRLNTDLKRQAKDDDRKLLFGEQDLIVRALDEEQRIAVEKAAIYPNIMKNKVMQYKRMKVADWRKERAEERKKALKSKQPAGEAPEPAKVSTGLTPSQEVQVAKRLLTSVEKLAIHGYVPAVPSEESIEAARQAEEASKGWEQCCRCRQRFQVFPGRRESDGALTSGGPCTFHWGKTYITPTAPGMDRQPKRFQCCGEEMGDSVGCFTHDHHVFKTTDAKRLASILNFAETPENPLAPIDRAVAFDCEMAYTVYGIELIRVTATSWPTGERLLDVLVRPLGEILDLNSRYSGVWPEDLARAEPWSADANPESIKSSSENGSEDGEVKPIKKNLKIVSSPEVARDLLWSLISPTTPLIGHGLENDLNAMRMVHPTLIDTILLYPHHYGLPSRNGLKMLMERHLNRKIQQETGPKMLGHDSAEDARAAGDLVRLKVKNEWTDMKLAGWKIVDGELVAPGTSAREEKVLTEEFIES